MPKDPAENIDRYKIQGGQLNEFELQQNEEAMAEQERARHGGPQPEGLRGAAEPGLPQNVAERIQQLEAAVREKVERRRAKQAGQSVKNAPAKAAEVVPKSQNSTSAKKTASAPQPSGGKKAGAARKAKKSGTKVTATKKGAAKKQTGAAKAAKSPAKKASPAKRSSSKKRPVAGKPATKSGSAKGAAKGAAKKAASKKGSKARRG